MDIGFDLTVFTIQQKQFTLPSWPLPVFGRLYTHRRRRSSLLDTATQYNKQFTNAHTPWHKILFITGVTVGNYAMVLKTA